MRCRINAGGAFVARKAGADAADVVNSPMVAGSVARLEISLLCVIVSAQKPRFSKCECARQSSFSTHLRSTHLKRKDCEID